MIAAWGKAMNESSVDIFGWIRAGAHARGELPLAAMPRLAEMLASESGSLTWEAIGRPERDPLGGERLMLTVRARARPALQCARCLEPVAVDLTVERTLCIVANEALAERLDEQEAEIDVLAGSLHFDLLELVEDEAILALVPFATHEKCVAPRRSDEDEGLPTGALAGLAALKGGGTAGSR